MTDEHPALTATVDYVAWSVHHLKREIDAYGPAYSDQIIKELKPVHDEIHDILKTAHNNIYDARKICNDPADAFPSICRICPNCTMALDGAPMCALTRRGLDL